jgi:hypothetical protein
MTLNKDMIKKVMVIGTLLIIVTVIGVIEIHLNTGYAAKFVMANKEILSEAAKFILK